MGGWFRCANAARAAAPKVKPAAKFLRVIFLDLLLLGSCCGREFDV